MAYGFRAYNNSGFTQIDETTQGFQVLSTGIVPASDAYSVNYVTIPSSYPDDILVIAKPHDPNTTLQYRIFANYMDTTTSGGTRIRRAYMNCAYGTVILAMAACDYAIIQRCSLFDDSLISGQSPANYGLNVYRTDGTLSFTTEKPTFRVRSARHHEVTDTDWGAGVWHTATSVTDLLNTYALAMNYGGLYRRTFGPSSDREYVTKSRLGAWNYNTTPPTFSTHIQSAGGGTNEQTEYTRVWKGHRTEMVGYIV